MQSIAWAAEAAADSYTLSFEIPDHGAIDLYHDVYSSRDPISNSLYLLRNVAIEDALNTRHSLKILLGGTARARAESGQSQLTFDVPGGVTDLYLVGDQLGANASATSAFAPNAIANSTPVPGAASHTIETGATPEIAREIHWLADHEPAYDPILRTRLLLGLAHISAQITKFDHQIDFIRRGFWEDPTIKSEFYAQDVKSLWEPIWKYRDIGERPNYSKFLASRQATWFQQHQMEEVLQFLDRNREYLLVRYHLLGTDVEGQPLYQHIYASMQNQGFPAANQAQPAADPHLPAGVQPMTLPKSFDLAVDQAENRLADPALSPKILQAIYGSANHKIDLALSEALTQNTDRLAVLTQEINYTGDLSSPLAELGKYDDLWNAAIGKYGYLQSIVDMTTAHDDIKKYWKTRDATVARLRYAAQGASLGLGIAGMVFTGGTANEATALTGEAAAEALQAFRVPLQSWLLGTGLFLDAGASLGFYFDSKRSAEMARGLYQGTRSASSPANMQTAMEINEADLRMMVASFSILGLATANLARLALSQVRTLREGVSVVQLTEADADELRQTLAGIKDRSAAVAPLGKALVAKLEEMLGTINGLVGTAVRGPKIVELAEGIENLAKELRVSPGTLLARIESKPGLGYLIKGWRMRGLSSRIEIADNILAQLAGKKADVPLPFLKGMATNALNEFVVDVVSERAALGSEAFGKRKGRFAADIIRGQLISAIMVWNGAGANISAAAREQVTGLAPQLSATQSPLGRFMGTGAGRLAKTAGSNGMVGIFVKGAVDGGEELWRYAHDKNSGPTDGLTEQQRLLKIAKGSLWSGTTMTFSSTLRYKLFKSLEAVIAKQVTDQIGQTILIQSMWTSNNFFGNWSYVTWGEAIGVFDKSGNPVPATRPDDQIGDDISGIQLGSSKGAYFKVNGPETSASYLFDFLSGGAEATGVSGN